MFAVLSLAGTNAASVPSKTGVQDSAAPVKQPSQNARSAAQPQPQPPASFIPDPQPPPIKPARPIPSKPRNRPARKSNTSVASMEGKAGDDPKHTDSAAAVAAAIAAAEQATAEKLSSTDPKQEVLVAETTMAEDEVGNDAVRDNDVITHDVDQTGAQSVQIDTVPEPHHTVQHTHATANSATETGKERSTPVEQHNDNALATQKNQQTMIDDGNQGSQKEPPPATTISNNNMINNSNSAEREKIIRLSRLVQGLKQKIERLESENVQLEEELATADAARLEITKLEDALAKEQTVRISLEASLRASLAAQDGEIASLKEQLETTTARMVLLSETLASKEAEIVSVAAERSVNENQLIASLRKEIETTEATLEEERKAHAASRRASAAREQELDASVADAAASLAAMQRTVEDRAHKLTIVEERCRELEHEVGSLGQKLALATKQLESTASLQHSESSSNLALQRVEELETSLLEARNALNASEVAKAAAIEEKTRLQLESETLRRQLMEARATDSADLRRRLQEATDALYSKQVQMERLTAEKAAMQLQLERNLAGTTSENLKRRTAAVDRLMGGSAAAGALFEDSGIVPMESLGDTYRKLANAPGHLGQAVQTGARFLDSTASQAVRVLRHHPLGRLAVFCYFVGMHLFIWLLLHRLQRHAFSAAASLDVSEEDGLVGNDLTG